MDSQRRFSGSLAHKLIAWPQYRSQALVLQLGPLPLAKDLVPVNGRESCQGHCGGYTLSSLCCFLSFIKMNMRPDFFSTFVSSLLIFSVTRKTYLLMCFRGSGIYYCPPLTETQACNAIAFSLLAAGGEAQGWVRAGAVGSKCKCSPESGPLFLWRQFGLPFDYLYIFPLQVLL